MADNPFAHLSLGRAVALRCSLRDIEAERLTILPLRDEDLHLLLDLGLVELRQDKPVLTPAGMSAIG